MSRGTEAMIRAANITIWVVAIFYAYGESEFSIKEPLERRLEFVRLRCEILACRPAR